MVVRNYFRVYRNVTCNSNATQWLWKSSLLKHDVLVRQSFAFLDAGVVALILQSAFLISVWNARFRKCSLLKYAAPVLDTSVLPYVGGAAPIFQALLLCVLWTLFDKFF